MRDSLGQQSPEKRGREGDRRREREGGEREREGEEGERERERERGRERDRREGKRHIHGGVMYPPYLIGQYMT